jgi:ATPase subunit of ABC transporter with duplicated ATPase domains
MTHSHSPIGLTHLSFHIPIKNCFNDFSTMIHAGQRIGIVGRNGSGKTTLLKIINQLMEPTLGTVNIPTNVIMAYVPQIIYDYDTLSGGQRFQKELSHALSTHPNCLLLDEPTNHLDSHNQKSLHQMLSKFKGTLIISSHDEYLLNQHMDTIFYIHDERIDVFNGNYDDFKMAQSIIHTQHMNTLDQLKTQQKKSREAIQHEQKREGQSRRANIHENDRKLKGNMKEKGSKTIGKNRERVNHLKKEVDHALTQFKVEEIIVPRFFIDGKSKSSAAIVTINNGECGYDHGTMILKNLYFNSGPHDRICIQAPNGHGKTTLFKAILNDPSIIKHGEWHTPEFNKTGYVNQHYDQFNPESTVFEIIKNESPTLDDQSIRSHLNDYLFRKNEEVNTKIKNLSGGEKARLSLAHIAIKMPHLLLLDEITNNLDMETKNHVITVLNAYPGSIIIISHDIGFLNKIDHLQSFILK